MGSLIFKIPLKFKVSQISEIFEKKQKELDIADVAITNSSLEDVFMNVVLIYEKRRNVVLGTKLGKEVGPVSFRLWKSG